MKQLYYTISTLEPLIISQNSDDPNMCETLQYIRGTNIQGIFAQNYLSSKTADNEFNRLIIKGGCVFSNAYPIVDDREFIPASSSLVREKYKTDIAHNLLVNKTDVQTTGIQKLINVEDNVISGLIIPKQIHLHNEIDDKKRTTKTGILFNYQSLPSGMIFKGYLSLKDEKDENAIHDLIKDGSEIRMGRSATSEYGKIRFNWIENNQEETKSSKGIESTTIQKGMGSSEGEVIMTLLSDTIILNKNGFSSLNFIDINDYLEGAKIEETISRKSRIEGFLSVWKLRKPSENVFVAGSSFLLDKLPVNSNELLIFGLGIRTQEGYGQVSFSYKSSISNPLIYSDYVKDIDSFQLHKGIPNMTKNILVSAYLNRAKSKIINKALMDAEETHNAPKNHLVGKLKEMSQNIDSFNVNIGKLRETATRQLKKANINGQTLQDHLLEFGSNINLYYTLKQEIEGIQVDLSDKKMDLTKLYFEQYFNQLRRKNKKQ